MNHYNSIRHIADSAAFYRICLYGHLTPDVCEQLGGMKATVINAAGGLPMTVLAGHLLDQAALAGVLTSLYDYGVALISLERRETELVQRS